MGQFACAPPLLSPHPGSATAHITYFTISGPQH